MSDIVVIWRPVLNPAEVFDFHLHHVHLVIRDTRPESTSQYDCVRSRDIISSLMKQDMVPLQCRLHAESASFGDAISEGKVAELVVPENKSDSGEVWKEVRKEMIDIGRNVREALCHRR